MSAGLSKFFIISTLPTLTVLSRLAIESARTRSINAHALACIILTNLQSVGTRRCVIVCRAWIPGIELLWLIVLIHLDTLPCPLFVDLAKHQFIYSC